MTIAIPSETTKNPTLIGKLDGLLFGNTDLNTTFSVKFTKGGNEYTKSLRVIDINYTQNMGEIPIYAVAFGM